MNAKQYKMCVADAPEALSAEVSALAAEGWQPYGYPFVNPRAEQAPRAYCQAMVLAGLADVAVAGSAVPKPVARGIPATPSKPARPPIRITARGVATGVAAVLALIFLTDAAIFRSGRYAQIVEPLSNTGNVERLIYFETNRKPFPGKKEVLVVGDSRMAEGFSAKRANEARPEDNFFFSHLPISFSDPRVWYYFVRDLDSKRNRYAELAIPIADYADPDGPDDPADQPEELEFVINRIGMFDALPYAFSFPSFRSKLQVLWGETFQYSVYRKDVADYQAHKKERLEKVEAFRKSGNGWFYDYGGNPDTLAGMSVDWAAKQVSFPPGFAQDRQDAIRAELFAVAPQHGYQRDFEANWLGKIADLYRDSKTKVVFFQLPRGPAPRPEAVAKPGTRSVDELRKRSWVTILDPGTFANIEKPEYFFDLHRMNQEGNKVFSVQLAEKLKETAR